MCDECRDLRLELAFREKVMERVAKEAPELLLEAWAEEGERWAEYIPRLRSPLEECLVS